MDPEWLAQWRWAQAQNGLLVDAVPLSDRAGSLTGLTLSQADHDQVIFVEELVRALHRTGQISSDDLARCVSTGLFTDFAAGRVIALPTGKPVLLTQGFAVGLERAGILNQAARHCRLFVTRQTVEQTRAEAQEYDRRFELTQWLAGLLDHVQAGIRQGTYQTFAAPTRPSEDEQGVEPPESRCLDDLFCEEATRGKTIWCDDRFLTGVRFGAAASTVGILDVLHQLRRDGVLDADGYFDRLDRLRRSDVRYLPVSEEEIVYHLRRAPMQDGLIQETPTLAALRRSAAVCLLDEGRLNAPSATELAQQQLSEMTWLKTLMVSCTQAVLRLWREDSVEDAQARADWIINSLHVNTNTLCEALVPDAALDQAAEFLGHDIAAFFGMGMTLPSESPLAPRDPSSRRWQFYRWAETRLIARHVNTNPAVLLSTKETLADALNDFYDTSSRDPDRTRAAQLAVFGVFLELPDCLQEGFRLPPAIEAEFGALRHAQSANVLGLSFEVSTFWAAVQEAVNGRTTTIRDDADTSTCRFEPVPGSPRTSIAVVNEATGERQPLSDRAWEVLADDTQERAAFLNRYPELFDLAAARRAAAVTELVTAPEAHQRMKKLADYQNASAPWFYRKLEHQLRSHREHLMDWFAPPSAESLLRHLRLPETGPIDWEQTATQLLVDEGWQEAVLRLSSLPRLLPSVLRGAWRDMPTERARPLVTALNARLRTPLERIHLYHLLLERSGSDDVCREQTGRLKAELLDPRLSDEVYAGFRAILQWSLELFSQWAESRVVPAAQRLALGWIHASRVHNILLSRATVPDAIRRNFAAEHQRLEPGLDFGDAMLRADVASTQFAWRVVLARGLGAVTASLSSEIAPQARLSVEEVLGGAVGSDAAGIGWRYCMRETELAPNALDSFLGGPWDTPLRALLGEEAFRSVFPVTPLQLAAATILALEADPHDWHQWLIFRSLLREGPIHAVLRDRIRALLTRVDFSAGLAEYNDDWLRFVVAVNVCAAVSQVGATDLQQRFEGQILTCAQICQRAQRRSTATVGEDRAAQEALANLLHAAKYLAVGMDRSPATFYRLASKAIHGWLDAGSALLGPGTGNVPPLPLPRVQGAWRYYLTLRGVA